MSINVLSTYADVSVSFLLCNKSQTQESAYKKLESFEAKCSICLLMRMYSCPATYNVSTI